ncbi:ribonuclease E inhibitor RraB [Rathayibacter sp. YIM 133350]|uniref:ribonuclease E inhibitor RraB n=1 Tax=Rathayibacter sp. YIM 133350 TaxID=3131992 RepID=UPI00307F7DE3
MPTERTRRLASQFAVDRAQLENRRILGDDLAQPRDVEHFAYFPDCSALDAAARQLEGAGFTGSIFAAGGRFSLCARRVDALDEESVRRFVRDVCEIVEANGGEYDGWGAPVIVARRPTISIPDSPADIHWS